MRRLTQRRRRVALQRRDMHFVPVGLQVGAQLEHHALGAVQAGAADELLEGQRFNLFEIVNQMILTKY